MTAGRRPPTADRRLSGAPGPGCVVQPVGRAVLGLPGGVRWVARHDGYEPPNRFTDELVSLPLHWRHVHEFAAEGAGATRVTDRVETPVPAALLRQTFYYRHAQLAGDLAVHRAMSALQREPMTVAMTGSSGLIGSALTAFLTTGGHRVVRLVRHDPRGADERRWQPENPDRSLLDGVDALVHLAGASIAGRFTQARKRRIRDSRVEPTRRLAELIAAGPYRPRAFVVASAIGYYGSRRGDEQLDGTASIWPLSQRATVQKSTSKDEEPSLALTKQPVSRSRRTSTHNNKYLLWHRPR